MKLWARRTIRSRMEVGSGWNIQHAFTCVTIIKARLLNASDDESSRSLVNVLRRDLKVTLLVTTEEVVVASAAVVARGEIAPVTDADMGD